jgi:flavin-dependent dehydrogenase
LVVTSRHAVTGTEHALELDALYQTFGILILSTIAIIGGGLAGLTLSIGLTRYGIPHKIYESASAFSEIGAGIALGPNSISALELIDPRIKEGLKKCITYNEGVNEEGEGKGKEEWMDIRVGVEDR